ncbi:hypothetical protein G9A89_023207 [Geosiphon pyriformis]|nr:hypothetical protein G9A89_023207 [Geosiphon pyriformis]
MYKMYLSTAQRWIGTIVVSGAVIGFGYGLMKLTSPSDEKVYQSLSPELKKEVDKNRETNREKNAALMALLKKAAESEKPVWDLREFQKELDSKSK